MSVYSAAECVDCRHTQGEMSSFTIGGIIIVFVVFELFYCAVQLILSVRSLHCDNKTEAERRISKNTYFVLFFSAEFLSRGEMWNALISGATVVVLFWSNNAVVHITDCQSLALKL